MLKTWTSFWKEGACDIRLDIFWKIASAKTGAIFCFMVKYWDAYIIKTLANPLLIDYNMSIESIYLKRR